METPGSTIHQKYAFISADEVDEYREKGLTEAGIRSISEKRQQRADELMDGYNSEEFPYITKGHYEQQVAKGDTRSKLEALNKQLGEELSRFRSNMTLVPPPSNSAHQGSNPVFEDLRIALFGLSGEGLSATGNTILGRKLLSEKSPPNSAEHEIRAEDGRKITILKISFSEDDIGNPGRKIEEADVPARVDVFLLIVNIANHRDLKTQAELWQNIKTYNKDIVARCILVLTHADLSFRGDDCLSSIYANYVDEKNAVPFGAVMGDLHPRIVALNNLSQSQQQMHVQQEQIMLMIDAVSQELRGEPGEEPSSQADWEMQIPAEEKPPSQTDEVLPSPVERSRSIASQGETQAEDETKRNGTQGEEGARSESADGGSTGDELQKPHSRTESRDDDSCEHLFGKMVTASLLELSSGNREMAKLRIQEFLYEMKVLYEMEGITCSHTAKLPQ